MQVEFILNQPQKNYALTLRSQGEFELVTHPHQNPNQLLEISTDGLIYTGERSPFWVDGSAMLIPDILTLGNPVQGKTNEVVEGAKVRVLTPPSLEGMEWYEVLEGAYKRLGESFIQRNFDRLISFGTFVHTRLTSDEGEDVHWRFGAGKEIYEDLKEKGSPLVRQIENIGREFDEMSEFLEDRGIYNLPLRSILILSAEKAKMVKSGMSFTRISRRIEWMVKQELA